MIDHDEKCMVLFSNQEIAREARILFNERVDALRAEYGIAGIWLASFSLYPDDKSRTCYQASAGGVGDGVMEGALFEMWTSILEKNGYTVTKNEVKSD